MYKPISSIRKRMILWHFHNTRLQREWGRKPAVGRKLKRRK